MKAKSWFICFVLSLVLITSAFGQGGDVVFISHDPVTFADVGQPVRITATLEGDIPNDQVVQALLRFRNSSEDSYDYEEMILTMNRFIGEIPGDRVISTGVEYCIEFELQDGRKVSFPASLPRLSPVVVNVRGYGEGGDESVIIISPEPDKASMDNEVLVAVAFNQALRQINPGDVIIRIDGQDRTGEATITENVLTALVRDLSTGKHRFEILVKTDGTPQVLKTWFYTQKSGIPDIPVRAKKPFLESVRGEFGFEGRTQRYSGLEQSVAREHFSLRGKWGDFSAVARGRFTSEEQGNLQPQHRFLVSFGQPWWRIRLGDVNPRYNELVLWGRRVRGAEMNLISKKFRLNAIYGEVNRAIEGRFVGVDTTYADANNVITENFYSGATYKRWLTAMKMGFGDPDEFEFSLIFLKSKDESSSISNVGFRETESWVINDDTGQIDTTLTIVPSGQTYPKDNLVTGTAIEAFFDKKRISFKGEAALSLYNSNTLAEPLDETDQFKNFIWINQYFEPLPEEDDSTQGDIKTDDIVKSLFKNAVSYQTRLRLRYYNNDLSVGLRRISKSYITLGNPALIRDDVGWYIRDRIRLFENKVYLNLGWQTYHDNLSKKADNTLSRNEMLVGVSFFTGDMYPDLSLTYRNQVNDNDADYDTTGAEPDLVDSRITNNTNTFNVGLNHNLYFGETKNFVNLGLISSARTDDYNEFGESDQFILSLGLMTEYEFPMVTRLNVSNATQQAIGGLTDISYTTINARAEYHFLDRALVPFFGPVLQLGSGETSVLHESPEERLDPDDYVDDQAYQDAIAEAGRTDRRKRLIDFNKMDWIAGFEYRFRRNHTVNLYASFSMYQDNSTWQYWNGAEFGVEETEIVNDGTAITQPTEYKRDDYQVTLSYTYRF